MSQQDKNQSPDHIDQEVSEQEQLMRYRQGLLHYTYNSFLDFKREKELEQAHTLLQSQSQSTSTTNNSLTTSNLNQHDSGIKDNFRGSLAIA